MKARYRIITHITTMFWQRWSSEVSPGLVIRQKWHQKGRNLQKGDLVMICEPSKLKAKYKLAIVAAAGSDNDGCVRSVSLRYVNVRKDDKGEFKSSMVYVTRSIQRLVLIIPVEEQETPILVKNDINDVHCLVQS